jgi:hypothetical protein
MVCRAPWSGASQDSRRDALSVCLSVCKKAGLICSNGRPLREAPWIPVGLSTCGPH